MLLKLAHINVRHLVLVGQSLVLERCVTWVENALIHHDWGGLATLNVRNWLTVILHWQLASALVVIASLLDSAHDSIERLTDFVASAPSNRHEFILNCCREFVLVAPRCDCSYITCLQVAFYQWTLAAVLIVSFPIWEWIFPAIHWCCGMLTLSGASSLLTVGILIIPIRVLLNIIMLLLVIGKTEFLVVFFSDQKYVGLGILQKFGGSFILLLLVDWTELALLRVG